MIILHANQMLQLLKYMQKPIISEFIFPKLILEKKSI